MTEAHTGWITSMFSADSQFDLWTSGATFGSCNFHQLAHTVLIHACEWVGFHNFNFLISRKEGTTVITTHSQSCLGQVIRTKTEELSVFCNFICSQRTTRHFDHGSNEVIELDLLLFGNFRCNSMYNLDLKLQFASETNQRYHDFRAAFNFFLLLDIRSSLKNGTCLHRTDFRINHS